MSTTGSPLASAQTHEASSSVTWICPTLGDTASAAGPNTGSYDKISRAFVDREPAGNLTRDNILDNITLYWLTGTGASAARWYWEFGRAVAAAGAASQAPPPVSVPVGFTTFPGEIWAAPRSWVEAIYPTLTYYNEVDRGGHFAAWEQPALFVSELRAAFKSLRSSAQAQT